MQGGVPEGPTKALKAVPCVFLSEMSALQRKLKFASSSPISVLGGCPDLGEHEGNMHETVPVCGQLSLQGIK